MIANLPANGWFTQNNSVPLGTTGWFQGGVTPFPAHQGPETSYIGANFNNTAGLGTISNWLLTPNRTFSNGDTITFWTRTTVPGPTQFPDRLQVRLSTNGASTNVGTGATEVGDFTTLLLDINPTYGTAYPTAWTQFTITISGLAAPTSGRAAFRYFVENAGPSGVNSDFIGIDTFAYTLASAPAPVQHVVDFDGDGITDFSVARDTSGTLSSISSEFFKAGSIREKLRIRKEMPQLPELGGPPPVGSSLVWYSSGSSNGVPEIVGFGDAATDFLVPNDYDGDGETDFAVWRPAAPTDAAFYVLNSSDSTVSITPFGQNGDDPAITGDYDGDGLADPATYRCPAGTPGQCFFFFRGSAGGGEITYVPWGFGEDVDFYVNPGDFDGDGKYDFCIQRSDPSAPASGQFVLLRSSDLGVEYINWGTSSDFILPGDYDGDGSADFCVRRTVGGIYHHYVLERDGGGTGASPIVFGIAGDVSAPGDYDGDGKTDIAIWRENVDPDLNYFWVLRSGDGGVHAFKWGQQNDVAVANWSVH